MSEFSLLPDDAVVNATSQHPLMGRALFKVSEFAQAGLSQINSVYKHPGTDRESCEVLVPGSSEWKKGKYRYRVVVEFCPGEEG